jgi:signal transduction histidine kinase
LSTTAPRSVPAAVRRFRLRLFFALAAIVVILTSGGLYYTQRYATAAAERERQHEFRAALDRVRSARQARAAELTRRCTALVRKSRIHAALEDDALDLLYLSSRDELADLVGRSVAKSDAQALSASFYRFIDAKGTVIPLSDPREVGLLSDEDVQRIALPRIPSTTQLGYLARKNLDGSLAFTEIITTPIFSTTLGRPIAALVVGFEPHIATDDSAVDAVKRGIWMDGQLELRGLDASARQAITVELPQLVGKTAVRDLGKIIPINGVPHLIMCEPLNPASAYDTAYELCAYPLATTRAQMERVRWQILGIGGVVLLAALVASQLVAARMSRPVEQLAVESAVNAFERTRTQAALESTQEELARSARFSANASHQLKTPVAVMRAGLDELLARDDLPPVVREELTTLVQTTSQFSGMIDDLLLLSRMDAGRLRINFEQLDLMHLVASAIDDLSVAPNPYDLAITTDLPETLGIYGERRYVGHILQNLLENARRYNRPDGRITVAARSEGRHAVLSIGNTGKAIPPEIQPHVFDRFHRGGTAEDVPGHGLGLNLARELARLHEGDVRLIRSDNDWTEFEVMFRTTGSAPPFPSALR